MGFFKTAWKNRMTTLAGMMVMAATGAQIYGAVSGDPTANAMNWVQVAQLMSQVMIGGGLVAAKDGNVSGLPDSSTAGNTPVISNGTDQ